MMMQPTYILVNSTVHSPMMQPTYILVQLLPKKSISLSRGQPVPRQQGACTSEVDGDSRTFTGSHGSVTVEGTEGGGAGSTGWVRR